MTACAVFAVTLCTFVLFTGTAYGSHIKPIDSCVGVDHPPFERDYLGDGKSYLNVGLTLPLQQFEGGSMTGVLVGKDGRKVEGSDKVDANGRVFLSFPLYSYGAYEVLVTDAGGHEIFKQTVTVGPQEHPCDRESLAKSPPRVTESTQGANTEAKEEPKVETTQGPKAETARSSDRAIWPFVLIGLGLLLGAVGMILAKKRPCEKERIAWEEAERRTKEAREARERARKQAEQAAADRAALETELTEIRKAFPSAGKQGGDEAWIESDGRRITSRDLALRREAEQAAWQQYQENPNPETASELEDAWNKAAQPQSEAERRELEECARELEQQLNQAKETEREARRAADQAEQAAEQAAGDADATRNAFEKCIGQGTASGTEGGCCGVGGTDGASTGQGQGTQTRERRCREDEPPQERNQRELGVVTFTVRLEVQLSGGDAHEAAKEAREISDQLADYSDKLGWISKAMDLKGIGSALVRDGFGWTAIEASGAPLAGTVMGTPVPTSPGQAAVDYLSTVTNIASIIVGKVPELQDRRMPDCEVSISTVTRTVRATCTEIWVCRGGEWVFDRTRFTLTVVREGKSGPTREAALTWQQAQVKIATFEIIQMRRLQDAIDQIARFEAGCGS